jgi:hypothetical protein
MPYQIDRYNGTPLVTVDDGTISNEKTSLKLVGKNYAGYGEIQNENFVFLTENFANAAPPANYLSGQIWFDSFNRKLKFNDGNQWRTTGGAEIGPTPPTGLTTGDFWWNTTSKQLYSYDGISEFVLIGPQAVPGAGDTLLESVSVLDIEGNRHAIIKALVDGTCIYIFSKDTFILDSIINPITGFSYIRSGLTLVDTNTSGQTLTSYRHWGTASDSDRLGSKLASDYVLSLNAVFQGTATFDDSGFTVGNDGDLAVFINGGTIPTIQNLQSNKISFKIKDSLVTKETMQVLGGAVDPGLDNTYDLGEPSLRWRRIYGVDFYGGTFHGAVDGDINGIAAKAKKLYFANAFNTAPNESDPLKYVSATDLNETNTIVARDYNGNFAANIIDATATRARYADLAEKYEADSNYEPGTVVVFGGEKEITVTTELGDYRVAGVVSTNPAYIMNVSSETEEFLPIALRGKVPVKVVGRVKKGDVLVTSGVPGHAVSVDDAHQVSAAAIVAKALEDKFTDEAGIVMAVIV